jgi:trafficking protein particle complex subunit 9
MTLPMLETLRRESARIHLELFRRGSEADELLPISRNGGTYYPAPYEFVYLRMRIANRSRAFNLPFAIFDHFWLTKRPL